MRFEFQDIEPSQVWETSLEEWSSWAWQMKNVLKSGKEYSRWFHLSEDESVAFKASEGLFKSQTTPYYAQLADPSDTTDPIRQMQVPSRLEFFKGGLTQFDPLAEADHSVTPRLVHRYSDRVLFLVTDLCSMYCRFCTRKRFTGRSQVFPAQDTYKQSLDYIRAHPGIREVILSGGDALTLSDQKLEKVLSDIREIDHVEIIRLGSRVPVVNPFRVDEELGRLLRRHAPVYVMTHFNHPREVTLQSKRAIEALVDNGVPVFNQMVLLNGINNHPAIVQALSRRLLYLRVKPYYMLQCDPSEGTEHFRTSVQNSEDLQKDLWGHLSGLAMPNLIVDLPNGGGKVGVVPNYEISRTSTDVKYKGWDGIEAEYRANEDRTPSEQDVARYEKELASLKNAKGLQV